jgi:hypothetical protein
MEVGDKVRVNVEEGEVIEVHDNGIVVVLFDGYEMWTHPENLTVINEPQSWNHVRIVGSMRVPEGITDDEVADALVALVESRRWGFTGICKVMTEAELAGEEAITHE